MVMNGCIEFREVERKLEGIVAQSRAYINGKWQEWQDDPVEQQIKGCVINSKVKI